MLDTLLETKNPCLTFDTTDLKSSYRSVVKQCHPDKFNQPHLKTKAEQVFHKVERQYRDLTELMSVADIVGLRQYFKFEYGYVLIYDTKLVYLFTNGKEYIRQYKPIFKYPNEKFRKEFTFMEPETHLFDNKVEMVKEAVAVPLRNLHQQGPLDPRHVAWIISRLLNIDCLLSMSSISHNAITLDNCFVNTDIHAIRLYGGWHFATTIGSKLKQVNLDIFNILPEDVKINKRATEAIDLLSIKHIARQLISIKMPTDTVSDLPDPFKQWLFSPPQVSPFEEFQHWDHALEMSYGVRKFVKYPTNMYSLYNVN